MFILISELFKETRQNQVALVEKQALNELIGKENNSKTSTVQVFDLPRVRRESIKNKKKASKETSKTYTINVVVKKSESNNDIHKSKKKKKISKKRALDSDLPQSRGESPKSRQELIFDGKIYWKVPDDQYQEQEPNLLHLFPTSTTVKSKKRRRICRCRRKSLREHKRYKRF